MAGIQNLTTLLESLQPVLDPREFIFCCTTDPRETATDLQPLGMFFEDEGATLILERSKAESAGYSYEGIFRRITLLVYSSLHAVGLTAAVAGALTERGISANVVAAFHHDHIFVPADRADEALRTLMNLVGERR